MFYFIRHNKLEKPFDNYDKMSYFDLLKLSKQEISPSISTEIRKTNIINDINKNRNNIDLVFVSPQIRTQETAKLLWFNNYEIIDELNEIYFDLNYIMDQGEYLKHWMALLRKRFWYNIINNEHIESIWEIKNRVIKLKKIMNKYKDRNVLFISHWFYLAFLKQHILDINWNNKSYPKINYLDWFKIV